MVKLIKESLASSTATDLLEINRSKHVSLCLHDLIRLQVYYVLARNCSITGVQTSPKLSVMVRYVERGNAVFPPYAMYGRQTVRHAIGMTVLRMWKKRMPFCNEMDRTCNMVQPEIKNHRFLRIRCRLPRGVLLYEYLNNLRR